MKIRIAILAACAGALALAQPATAARKPMVSHQVRIIRLARALCDCRKLAMNATDQGAAGTKQVMRTKLVRRYYYAAGKKYYYISFKRN